MYRNTFVFISVNLYNTLSELNRAGLIDPSGKTGVEREEVTHSRSHSQEVAGQHVAGNFSFHRAHICYMYTHCKPTSRHVYPLAQVHKLTTSQPVVSGELESIFRAVPAFPGKLELTLLDATLGT